LLCAHNLYGKSEETHGNIFASTYVVLFHSEEKVMYYAFKNVTHAGHKCDVVIFVKEK